MDSQLDRMGRADWDVLIVLDACRADAFGGYCSARAETVRSAGVCTPQWLCASAPALVRRGVLYATANPIVDRENGRHALGLDLWSLWRRHWGAFTPERIPSVHPMSVTAAVLAAELPADRPLVVHYLQPHCPYIGHPPLKAGRWYASNRPLGGERIGRVGPAVRAGRLTWAQVGAAYAGNLALAWDAVQNLVEALQGLRIVVTADHGEMLGEDGKFGHEAHWTRREELWLVPWLEVTGGHRVDADRSAPSSTREKLEALGYV